jgi:hypothetical protein
MAVAMNVVALGGIPGISVIAVTHGLGGVSATPPTPPVNPHLALSGAENEEWWQKGGRGEAGTGRVGVGKPLVGSASSLDREEDESHQEEEGFSEEYGYLTQSSRDEEFAKDIAWELGEPPYQRGPISLGDFTARAAAEASEEGRVNTVRSVLTEIRRREIELERRRKLVRVTVSIAGLTYIAWRIIPLL